MTPTRYRAYCKDCGWQCSASWYYEESAYEDLDNHLLYDHAGDYGVKEEED